MDYQRKRLAKESAITALHVAANSGVGFALKDLLLAELDEAQQEMEIADSEISVWRAQGRVQCVRSLIATVTPRETS